MSKIPLDAETIEGFTDQFLIANYDEPRPTPDCHREWWALATDPYPYVCFAAPRGHAKSTAVNHAYGLAASLFQQHPFQIKVSKTYDLACEKVEQAKQELITNEKIKKMFRLKAIIRDRENDFIAEMSDGYRFRMMALGMNQSTRGRSWGTIRPTLIQGDDMEDDEEVLNKERREKSMRWFMNVLLPMGGDRTQFRIYGTILHNDSVLMQLCKMSMWKSKVWSACDENVSEESILWPQKFTRERLLAIRQNYVEAGNLMGFNMEYRNIAIDLTSGFFRPEDFRPLTEEDEKRRFSYYVGVDFAISTADRRDFTAIAVAALDEDGTLYFVDVRRGRWDGLEIVKEMMSIEETYQPQEWYVEDGAIYKALTAALEIFMREANDHRGLYLNLVPMTPVHDKEARARPLQARMRARHVKFHKQAAWFPDFENELLQFPRSEKKDQVDAAAWVGMGLRRMRTPISQPEEEEILWRKESREHLSLGRSEVTGW